MKIHLDRDRCTGHGRCYGLAPELFDCDDLGYGLALVEEVPAGAEDDAHRCVVNCPERAITLSD
jgi:ferredoxin